MRVFKEIKVGDKKVYALFDTGSMRSYIKKELISDKKFKIKPFEVGLGGKSYEIEEACILLCSIDGLEFDVKAYPIEEIGRDEHGREIEMIIGATCMEEWGLIPNPMTGDIDLTLLRKREFREF